MNIRRFPAQVFAVGKNYESRLSRLQRRHNGTYLLNHGVGRYSAFAPYVLTEGLVNAGMVECVGIEPARAMEYFGMAIGGKRTTDIKPIIKQTMNTAAKMTNVPDNYPAIVLTPGVLSGFIFPERAETGKFEYTQALGNLHGRNIRKVQVMTRRLGLGEIFWEASGDNTSDEMIARDDFLSKVPAKLVKKK